jgi:hypothetical protein
MRNSKNLWEGLVSVIGRAGRGLWSLALGFHRESRALSSVLSDPVSGVKGGCDQVKRSPLAAKAATILLLLTDRLKCLRVNCAVPQGTRPYFPPQPAFPRWAIVVSPCGLRSWYLPNSRLPPQVRKLSSHTLKAVPFEPPAQSEFPWFFKNRHRHRHLPKLRHRSESLHSWFAGLA